MVTAFPLFTFSKRKPQQLTFLMSLCIYGKTLMRSHIQHTYTVLQKTRLTLKKYASQNHLYFLMWFNYFSPLLSTKLETFAIPHQYVNPLSPGTLMGTTGGQWGISYPPQIYLMHCQKYLLYYLHRKIKKFKWLSGEKN